MNFKLTNILFLFSFYLLSLTIVFSQPCGPKHRFIDRQTITANGDILLLRTEFNGGLMDVFDNQKTFELNYVLISPKGYIIKDTILNLGWNEWHYDFMTCEASYKYPSALDYSYKKENNCVLYFPFSQNDTTILEYYLGGDRKFAYEITIDKIGNGYWTLYDLDTIGNSNIIKYHDDVTKHFFFKNYLEENHKKLNNLPTEQFEFLNEKSKIKIQSREFELNQKSPDKKWAISCKKWTIALDGSIFNYNDNPPLINFKNDIAYITVFNEDFASCPGYGQDIFPITYAIDIKKGKIIWKRELKMK